MILIHKTSLAKYATIEHARRDYAKRTAAESPIGAGISFDPHATDLLQMLHAAGYYTDTTPEYNSATHKLGDLVWDDVGCTVIADVVPLTAEELREFIPDRVTMRQARIYLARTGMIDTITAQIEQLGGEALITWEYSQEVQRSNPLVSALGFTDEQLDTMFLEASQL